MQAAETIAYADLLNQTLRRLKQYETESEWATALLDGAAQFADAVAVFTVENSQLRLCGVHRLNLPARLTIPLHLGRALETAAQTRDTVVALRTPGEVTAHLSEAGSTDRAVVVPILNGPRVVAILFAASNAADHTPMLELVAGMASLVLERSANASATVRITPAKSASKLPFWSVLDEEQRRLHIRAQRFSRVKVAEMHLFQPDACRAGREQNNIYLFLKKEIDSARESYRDEFMARPGMEDYLHLELVRTAAGGDEKNLGADYPGHLG